MKKQALISGSACMHFVLLFSYFPIMKNKCLILVQVRDVIILSNNCLTFFYLDLLRSLAGLFCVMLK